jgi:D-inositol-3-phosphate glycosyltransferase
VNLLISGEFYQSPDIYWKMINDLGFAKHVQVHSGFVPPHEVGKFFAAADAVILPYKSATQSGVSKMAYYFDRPLIVSDVGGLPNEIEPEQTGVLARPDDPGSLADAIKHFFTLATTVNFVENVRKFKQRYDWNHFLSALGELDAENLVPVPPMGPRGLSTRASAGSLS